MSVTEARTGTSPSGVRDRGLIVNDFSITAATVNGSGSQTANSTLLRAIHKMGVPVSGKNLFPSNIQGLPTWFTIRVSREGYLARREQSEILVAMNKATMADDIQKLESGGICLHPIDDPLPVRRDDVIYYPMPVLELSKKSGADAKLRPYVANMVYVGALAFLLGINLNEIEAALTFHFGGKQKPIELNMGVVRAAHEWAAANLTKTDPYRIERMEATAGTFLIDGNTASALGAIFGGVTFAAWYPITPATSLADALNTYLPRLRRDLETGKATYSVIQAEDEIAALGMVIGAGWAGARAMTSTSGPGISLMAEFAGFAYFAEIPSVIWDIQRMGPSTGLPTRVSQGDILAAYFLGHGDTRHVCLLPASVQECFEFGSTAFDLAERLQTLVFVLSDLDIGMNLWPSEPFEYPDKPMDRGKVLSVEDLDRLGSWKRYADVDKDGIGWRTLPGTNHPVAAYFTRGSGHTEAATYTERPEDWAKNLERLARKHETARTLAPPPVIDRVAGAEIGIISYGSNDLAMTEARDRLAARGIQTSYLRLRALPLEQSLVEFIKKHERLYVVENNFDGQMHSLIQLHAPEHAARVVSVAKCDGLPLTARWITEAIIEQER